MEYSTSNYFYKLYTELKLSLAAAKASLRVREKELNILIYDGPKDVKGFDPSKERSNSTKMPPMELYNKISDLSAVVTNTKIFIKEIETQLENLAEEIEDMAGLFDDIELKVFNLRYIRGMKLKDIADETGYSYYYIREINSAIIKKLDPKNNIPQKSHTSQKSSVL